MRGDLVALVLMLALVNGGCAAVGLTLIGTGLGIAAGTGTAYTLDGIAYRTFSASLDDTRSAALTTMRRMDMKVQSDTKVQADPKAQSAEAKPESREIVALAGDRTIHIELERLTSRTTRMRVTAKQGWFFRDRSTAGEIIAQTADALEDRPALSQKGRS